MKCIALILVVSAMAGSHAQAQISPQSQCAAAVGAAQLAECLNAVGNTEEKRLNQVYNLIMKMFHAGAVDPMHSFFYDKQKELVAAERAWIRFRSAQCAAEATMMGPGASASGIVAATGDCMLKMTRERTAYLERIAEIVGNDSKLCRKSHDACRLE